MRYHDTRIDRRIGASLPVVVNFVDGLRVSWATNLSCGGIQLRRGVEDALEGDLVDLRFDLPDEEGTIECAAEVIYAEGGFLGLQFADLEVGDRYVLDRCIRKYL